MRGMTASRQLLDCFSCIISVDSCVAHMTLRHRQLSEEPDRRCIQLLPGFHKLTNIEESPPGYQALHCLWMCGQNLHRIRKLILKKNIKHQLGRQVAEMLWPVHLEINKFLPCSKLISIITVN